MKKLPFLLLLANAITPHTSHALPYKKIAQIGLETATEIALLALAGSQARREYKLFKNKSFDSRTKYEKVIQRTNTLLFAFYAVKQLNKKAPTFL